MVLVGGEMALAGWSNGRSGRLRVFADWLQDSLRSAKAHQVLPQPWQANRPVAALAIDYVREVVLGETVSVALHVKGAHDIQMLVTVAGQLRARAVLRAR